jgi:hypothetical protein
MDLIIVLDAKCIGFVCLWGMLVWNFRGEMGFYLIPQVVRAVLLKVYFFIMDVSRI